MPNPENIRLMATGPKCANKSIRKSRSIVPLVSTRRPGEGPYAVSSPLGKVVDAEAATWVRLEAGTTGTGVKKRSRRLAVDLCRRQLHRFAATAGSGLIGVIE